MHTLDEYGWHILPGDNGYGLAEVNRSIMVQGPVDRYVKQKNCAVEIGSYYGFTTKLLSTHFSKVYAFDLNTEVSKCFIKNMAKFKCENVVFNAHGLSNSEKYITNINTGHYMNKSIADSQKTFLVKKLDDYNIDPIDFLIVDTEGHEHAVLEGSINTIKKTNPVIICKFHNSANEGEDILTKQLGYKFVQQVSNNDRLYIHMEQL